MIRYLYDVIKYMKTFPLKNGSFLTWFRNCLYVNWQVPWKWNIDAYWLYMQIKGKRSE